MSTQTTRTDKILELVRKTGVLRPCDLDPSTTPALGLFDLTADTKPKYPVDDAKIMKP